MLFSGGMIPNYLVVKGLDLLDSYWALILPGAISAFNLIIVKNFFQELPGELEEAAKIDGCSDLEFSPKSYFPYPNRLWLLWDCFMRYHTGMTLIP